MRQEKLGAKKLVQFKYFLERMEDLTEKKLGSCGKADEVERQLRDRILKMEHDGEERRRVDWAGMDVDEPVDDMTCVGLGGSVGIDYPQEEQRKEQWRQGGQEEQLAEARTRRREWVWQDGEKKEDDEVDRKEKRQSMTRRRKGVKSVK